jgi:hypothetical protein
MQNMATPEGEIVSAICNYLALKHCFFWRNNNTPIYDPTRKLFRAMPQFTMKGIPDIIVIKAGRFIGIEVKKEKGRLSPEQVEFGRECVRNGGEYVVARSIDDVEHAGL